MRNSAGFTPEQAERFRREAAEQWVRSSEQKLRKLSKAEWEAVGAEGEAINRALAPLVSTSTPGGPEVQALVARHHAWIERFFEAPASTCAQPAVTSPAPYTGGSPPA